MNGYSPTGYVAIYQNEDIPLLKLPVVSWTPDGVAVVFNHRGVLTPVMNLTDMGSFRGVWPLAALEVSGAVLTGA